MAEAVSSSKVSGGDVTVTSRDVSGWLLVGTLWAGDYVGYASLKQSEARERRTVGDIPVMCDVTERRGDGGICMVHRATSN